jgi:hypothetical protein
VWRARAEQLVDKLGLSAEDVERACAALEAERQRGADIANPGAVLVARLESGWQPPPEPPPDPYARWGLDEEEVMGVRVGDNLLGDRPSLPPIVTASGVEHPAHGWFAALKGELDLQMARETYDTWLRSAELMDHAPATDDTPTTLTIRLHNLYAKAWIEHRLHKIIQRQAVRMLGKAVRLVYVGPEEVERQPGDPPWWAVTRTTMAETETERNAS